MSINGRDLRPRLIGLFNAHNITAVVGAAILLGEAPGAVFAEVEKLDPVEGRMERLVGPDGVTVVVDFAHTPDALEKAISNLSGLNANAILTIVGCGGDRDRDKRPLMADIAARLSREVILTSDNPRGEDPDKIIQEMLSGIQEAARSRVSVIADRKKAIETACAQAQAGSLVLIAGKGHEKYQEIKWVRHSFDDVAIAKAELAKRAEMNERE